MVLEKGQPLQCVFSKDFVQTDQEVADLDAPKPETFYCLLEMPEEEVEQLHAGKCFRFQESSNAGNIALCSETMTYEVEFLENSNSLFVSRIEEASQHGADAEKASQLGADVDKASQPDTSGTPPAQGLQPLCRVLAQCRGQLILKPGVMDAARVREILHKPAVGQAIDAKLPKVTVETLGYEVAASPTELQAMLNTGPYVEHDGAWRMLPAALESTIIDASISIVTARAWDFGAVDGEALLREVQQYLGEEGETSVPSFKVLQKALRTVTVESCAAPAADAEGDEAKVRLLDAANATGFSTRLMFDKDKIKRSKALQLLREPPSRVRDRFQLPTPARPKRARTVGTSGFGDGQPLQIEEFATAYRELADAEISTKEVLDLIADSAYVDDFGGTIHPLDTTLLPQEPRERLKRLFELQKHWNPERLEKLMAPALKTVAKAWLTKWARTVFVEIEPGKEERMLVKKFEGL